MLTIEVSIRIISSIEEMQAFSNNLKTKGKKIGFVPTMGYLHEGHLSLVRTAKKISDTVVVSIFVNPTQFAPNEDLANYPRDLERDKSLLEVEDVDAIFIPDTAEIYTPDFQTYIEVQDITKRFEGTARPTHFRGVTTIVAILFNTVKPDIAVFGQKDAQQAAVIKQMLKDLKYDIRIVIAPIIRESDGLAMSSRNVYLSKKERSDALVLSKALQTAEEIIDHGETDADNIKGKMEDVIRSAESADLDYIAIVDSDNFEETKYLEPGKVYYILIACKIGRTRLIDNLLIKKGTDASNNSVLSLTLKQP